MSERYACFTWHTTEKNPQPMGAGTSFWKLVAEAFPKRQNVRFTDGYRQDHGALAFEFFEPTYDGKFSHAQIFAKTPAAELWFMANLPADCQPVKDPQPIPQRVLREDQDDAIEEP